MLTTQECAFKCPRFCDAITLNLFVCEHAVIIFGSKKLPFTEQYFYVYQRRLGDSQIKQNIEVNNLQKIIKGNVLRSLLSKCSFSIIDLLIICTMPPKFCGVEY